MIASCTAILLLSRASSFSPPRPLRVMAPASAKTALPVSLSPLLVLNGTEVDDEAMVEFPAWDNALAVQQMEELEALSQPSVDFAVAADTPTPMASEREKLKRELAHAAITSFHPDALSTVSTSTVPPAEPRSAETIMKELEQIDPLPIRSPATHHSLNAHWSFVFTGVPTIGMRLITLLSRISTLFPFEILDFRDVALCVTDEQSQAKAIVEVKVCGAWELLLEVCTSLRRPTEEDLKGEYEGFRGEAGTLLLEHFQGVHLNGVTIPTPEHWHTTRTLEITYMDKDIMIARTSGGEPHLLLRNSPLCYSPDEMMLHVDDAAMEEEIEECDLEGGSKWTEFFSEAIEIYGERITRCLVDRDFGREAYKKKESVDGGDREWWKDVAQGLNVGRRKGE